MDSKNSDSDYRKNQASSPNMTSQNMTEKPTSGASVLFLWIWNWFTTLPKTMSNLYADFKNGELLARFTLLDAMLQFIVAVATSCHPQEEPMGGDTEELKTPTENKAKDSKVFEGTGRTLRSRTAAVDS